MKIENVSTGNYLVKVSLPTIDRFDFDFFHKMFANIETRVRCSGGFDEIFQSVDF